MGASASSPLGRSQALSSKLQALFLHFSTANPDSETPELHVAKAITTVIPIYIPARSAGGGLSFSQLHLHCFTAQAVSRFWQGLLYCGKLTPHRRQQTAHRLPQRRIIHAHVFVRNHYGLSCRSLSSYADHVPFHFMRKPRASSVVEATL